VTHIGKYEILGEVGIGAQAHLYRARDPLISREVAIKVLHAGSSECLKRFRQEAAAAGGLRHPNVVVIYDFGIDQGLPFLVMELLEGQDLARLVKSAGRLPLWRIVDMMYQAAQGLQHAHSRGVIHRDIAPSNIWLLPDGTVKLIDFGIAGPERGTRTAGGQENGTLSYLSPEELSDSADELSVRSDIFSFGTVFYELVAGTHPFEDEDYRSIICNIQLKDPPRMRSLAPDCPESLARIIHRALQKDPNNRYQTMRELLLDLEPIRIELGPEISEQVRSKADAHGSAVERIRNEAQKLAAFGQYSAAIQKIDAALSDYPGDLILTRLLDAVRRTQDVEQRYQATETPKPIRCPFCKASLTSEMRFCDRCGKRQPRSS
jgi:serine/threonine-protein kinase